MRKFLLLYLVTSIMFLNIWSGQIQAASLPQIDAEGAILIDQVSGRVLFAKNPDLRLFPASTTKILTALLILEHTNLEEEIPIGQEILYIGRHSSHAGLRVGEILTAADLLMALMLPSGNDAAFSGAVYVARKVSGSAQMPFREALDYFAVMMNQRAGELGAVNSNFTNPDGWHDPQHYTTARDLAIIAREAMNHPYLRTVVATRRYARDRFVGDEEPETRVWLNTNHMIRAGKEYYPYATGLKTGYTVQANSCLVISASLDGVSLIAVALKSGSGHRWQDARKLLDYGLRTFQQVRFVQYNQVIATLPVKGQAEGEPREVAAVTTEGFSDLLPGESADNLTMEIFWTEGVLENGYLVAPVVAGQPLGLVVWKTGGKVVFETGLVAEASIAAPPHEDGGGILAGMGPVLPGSLSLAGIVAAGVVVKRGRIFRRRPRRFV